MKVQVKIMATQQMVIFRVGVEEYAIPIELVKEIILYRGATRLPGTAEYIDGMSAEEAKAYGLIDEVITRPVKQAETLD